MDWGDLGKKIASQGATLLGAAIAGPGAGAGLGAIVAEALGVENDPGSIGKAIERDPEAAVKLQEIQSGERVRLREIASSQVLAEIKADQARHSEINTTMRAELAHDGIFKSGWRPFIGWVFGLSIGLLFLSLMVTLLREPQLVSNSEFAGLLTWLLGSASTVIGVNIRERSRDKRVSAGAPAQTTLERIASVVAGGRS